ncbi:MAG: DUF7677 family protein [Calditrichia bacterium]
MTLFTLFLQDFDLPDKELRVKRWLRSLVDITYSLELDLGEKELKTEDLADWKLAVIEFSGLIAESSCSLEPVLEYGSDLEIIYLVLMNNLKVDNNNNLVNKSHALQRALEMFKQMTLADYNADPPMEEWETVLV